MYRALVVYYSRSGHTRKAARRIAVALRADAEAIVDVRDRSGTLGYLRSIYEAVREKEAPIVAPRFDPAEFDLVVVGTPVWNASMASPVRTYLEHHGDSIRSLAVFCTEGGRGGGRALAQMAAVARRTPVGELVLRASELENGAAAAKITAFAEELREPGAHRPMSRTAAPPMRPSLSRSSAVFASRKS